ncbi:MAG TPA: glycosyltransferase family 9 protein [Candidatus Omnitrophota bacterium]|nr:glycosyltransferase family 9 protein [Candidatus Omnitrophota bacterium]
MSMYEIRNKKDRYLAMAADFVLRPFAAAVKMAREEPKYFKPPEIVKRVLIMRVDNIGDVVMATSLVRELKKKIFRNARIDLLVRPEAVPLLRNNPYAAEIIPYRGMRTAAQVRAKDYDVAIEPRGDLRYIFFLFMAGVKRRVGFDRAGGAYMLTDVVPYKSGMPLTARNMEIVKYFDKEVNAEAHSELFETETGAREADVLLKAIDARKRKVGIFPCSKFAAKEWEPVKFGMLAKKISDEGFVPAICGSDSEIEKCGQVADNSGGSAVNLAGKLSLEGLVSFVKRCDCVIGNDSAPVHIAAALDVPVIIVSGPMDADIVKPHHRSEDKLRVVFKRLPCSFCNSIKVLPAKCRGKTTPECLEKIEVDEVFSAFREVAAECRM